VAVHREEIYEAIHGHKPAMAAPKPASLGGPAD
jgi:sRNA-binding carbon storage regulator CsrA